jgi:hypothetical protein
MADRKAVVSPNRSNPLERLPQYPGVAITLQSILLKSPLTLHKMNHLHRDQVDVLAEPHGHKDVQEWSGDLDELTQASKIYYEVSPKRILRDGIKLKLKPPLGRFPSSSPVSESA